VAPSQIPHLKLSAERLTLAIGQALSDRAMQQRAEQLAEVVRREDGVRRAVEMIEAFHASGPASRSGDVMAP
jgi:UDP:flavonoid glycosyltransferase YjiC (YdhE family)